MKHFLLSDHKNKVNLLQLLVLLAMLSSCSTSTHEVKPNIIWINAEDIGPIWGCYGDKLVHTPNIDQLARKSILFTEAYAPSPMCAPARSALLTGVYPTSTGQEHLRSETRLPDWIEPLPSLMRAHGYFTTLFGKTDYNTDPDGHWDYWESDKSPWRKRKDESPFYSVFTINSTHEGKANDKSKYEEEIAKVPKELLVDPLSINLPPFHPNTLEFQLLWARYYNLIAVFDMEVGAILQELEKDGLTEETIIIIYADHGFGLPRYKRWLNKTGLQVPLLVHIPEKFKHLADLGTESINPSRVGFMDIVAATLDFGGISIPDYMDGQSFVKSTFPKDQTMFFSRGRADNAYEISRAVLIGDYLYIRHYFPHLPYIQKGVIFDDSKDGYRLLRAHREKHTGSNGTLSLFKEKPIEELYDLRNDPFEMNNLANDSNFFPQITRCRAALKEKILKTKDVGFIHESELEYRKGDTLTAFEIAQSNKTYHLSNLLDAAELVGIGSKEQFMQMLLDDDSGIRFWGIIGLYAYLDNGKSMVKDIKKLLYDPSPCVQIAAAEWICHIEEKPEAVEVLIKYAAGDNQVIGLHAARAIELTIHHSKFISEEVERIIESKKSPKGSGYPYIDYNYASFIAWSLEETLIRLSL